MNKIPKNIDIKIFLLCIIIITTIGVYITKTSTIIESNTDMSTIVSNSEVISYEFDIQTLWVIIETFTISLIIFFIVFLFSHSGNNNKKGTEEIQSNLKQHIYKLERTNRELIETKEELNQQYELLHISQEKIMYIEERYNMVFENAMIGVFDWNITESTVNISIWLRDVLGVKSTTMSTKEFLELMEESDREKHVSALYEYIERKKGCFNIKQKYRLKDGTYEWFEVMAKGVFSGDGLMVRICGSVKNINEQTLNSENMKKLAYTDYLTELPNKIAFERTLTQILTDKSYKNKMFMFLIDVDDLGIINNEVGNVIGDEVLKVVASRIKSVVASNNYIARLNGDEFVVLALDIDSIDTAHKKALSLIKELEKSFFVNEDKYYITASMGIVIAPDDGVDVDFLIKNATEAMYKAKTIGKNTYNFYTESLNQEIVKKLNMNNDIKLGIEKDEFFLVYQPQYNINTGKIVGFESLIRWKHREKGTIYPIDFMPVAEESGLIVSIGEKILIKACKQARDWWDNGFNDIVISINISTRQFNDKNFYNLLKNISDLKILKPKQINFEINENILFQDTAYCINTINKIKELGFTFSVHNVGINLMSIVTIKDLPINFIKLDRNFIEEQLKTDIGRDIIKVSIRLAHSMDYHIMAEGIEDEYEIEFFRQNNCSIAQGYYFSKPITDTEVDELLTQKFLV